MLLNDFDKLLLEYVADFIPVFFWQLAVCVCLTLANIVKTNSGKQVLHSFCKVHNPTFTGFSVDTEPGNFSCFPIPWRDEEATIPLVIRNLQHCKLCIRVERGVCKNFGWILRQIFTINLNNNRFYFISSALWNCLRGMFVDLQCKFLYRISNDKGDRELILAIVSHGFLVFFFFNVKYSIQCIY